MFGIIQHAVGTPDEVRKAGMDPARVGSCSEPIKGQNQGCAFWHKCIFQSHKNGGFRGHGPMNVGYFHQTHEGRKVENEVSCELFMDKLFERQRAGQRDREDGKNGEIIRIVAIEAGLSHPLSGQKILRTTIVNENANSPQLGHKWVKKVDSGPVRKLPRLGERGSSTGYEVQLTDRQAVREAMDQEDEPPVVRLEPGDVDAEATAEPTED